MTSREYIIGMSASCILCFFSWMLIIFYVDPTTTNFIGFALFYLSLFLFLSSLFAIIGFIARKNSKKLEFVKVKISFRQASLLSAVFVGTLILQNFGALSWWSAALLILSVSLLEFYLK